MLLPLYTICPFWQKKTRKKPPIPILQLLLEIDRIVSMSLILAKKTDNGQSQSGNRQQATGNRQQATGNYTHLLTNRVNCLTV
jgi:hypothetical protein